MTDKKHILFRFDEYKRVGRSRLAFISSNFNVLFCLFFYNFKTKLFVFGIGIYLYIFFINEFNRISGIA